MKKFLVSIFFLCGISAALSGNDYVRVSQKDPRYFETTDSKTWVPVVMNYLVPDRDTSLSITEDYFRRFSENGGNALRVWVSGGFLEVENRDEGDYSAKALNYVKRLVDLADKYNIKIKFTLTHIRTISTVRNRSTGWANRANLAKSYADMDEYVDTERGRQSYLRRASFLADTFRDSPVIWGWELWNEMNAAAWKNESWADFTEEVLPKVKDLFPNHTVAQTLGSMDRPSAEKTYALLLDMDDTDYLPVHRYLDEAETNYDEVKGPVDILASSAVRFALGKGKPVLLNEVGAVKPAHAGPSELYPKDTLGTMMHDMVFAPFFSGAAGCGAMWHWDSYVYRNNLWWHYSRFSKAIEGIDPAEEHFEPSVSESSKVRFYTLTGKDNTLLWCRDTKSDWRSELRDGIPAAERTGVKLKVAGKPSRAVIYNPWTDESTVVTSPRKRIVLPPFKRSLVVRFIYENN